MKPHLRSSFALDRSGGGFLASRVVAEPPGAMRSGVAVIGSGPGGAITACLLAEAGRDVLLIEEGPHLPVESCAPVLAGRDGREVPERRRDRRAWARPRWPTSRGDASAAAARSTAASTTGPRPRSSSAGGATTASRLWRRPTSARTSRPASDDSRVSYLPGPAPTASLKLHEGATGLGWQSLEVPRWFRYDAGRDRRPTARTPGLAAVDDQDLHPPGPGGRLPADARAPGPARSGGPDGRACGRRARSTGADAPLEVEAGRRLRLRRGDPDARAPAPERDHPERRRLAPDAPDGQGRRPVPRGGQRAGHGRAGPSGQGVRPAVQLRLLDQPPAAPGPRR